MIQSVSCPLRFLKLGSSLHHLQEMTTKKRLGIPVFSTGPWSSSIGCYLDPSGHGRSNVHGAGIRSSSQGPHVAFATGNAGGDPLEKGGILQGCSLEGGSK